MRKTRFGGAWDSRVDHVSTLDHETGQDSVGPSTRALIDVRAVVSCS